MSNRLGELMWIVWSNTKQFGRKAHKKSSKRDMIYLICCFTKSLNRYDVALHVLTLLFERFIDSILNAGADTQSG